jgi:hypothetical protein
MDKELDLESLEAEFEESFEDYEDDAEEESNEENLDVDSDEPSDQSFDEQNDESEQEDADDDSETIDEDIEQTEETPQESPEAETYRRQIEALEREIAESKKAANVIDELAKQSGVSRDELIRRYEQSQLAEEAKRQNVPVEYLEKQREMEKELQSLKEDRLREQFNFQVSNVKSKYNLSDDDISKTIDYAITNGLDAFNPATNFEAIYKAANFDTMLEQKVKETRQKELAEKQKRMNKSTVPHGGGTPSAPSVDDEVQSFLKEHGVI